MCSKGIFWAFAGLMVGMSSCMDKKEGTSGASSKLRTMRVNLYVTDEKGYLIEEVRKGSCTFSEKGNYVITANAWDEETDERLQSNHLTWEWEEDGYPIEKSTRNAYVLSTDDLESGRHIYSVTCKSDGYQDVKCSLMLSLFANENEKGEEQKEQVQGQEKSSELSLSSYEGQIGMLDGVEAIVVKLGNEKVAVATKNMGAKSINDYGNYYNIDGLRTIESSIPGSWYIPSKEQLKLLAKRFSKWENGNGYSTVSGLSCEFPSTGKSLFLPASGEYHNKQGYEHVSGVQDAEDKSFIQGLGAYGCYRSSDGSYANGFYCFYFGASGGNVTLVSDGHYSIRLFHDLE